MAASIPWTEALLCVWTVIVAVVAYRVGRRVAGNQTEPVGSYNYRTVIERKQPASEQQEYDDPWSAAMRGKGEREDTV